MPNYELFHSYFKENFYKEKPNIFMFLNIVKQVQIDINCTVRTMNLTIKFKDYRVKSKNF